MATVRNGRNNCKGDIFAVRLHQLDSVLLNKFCEGRGVDDTSHLTWDALPVYPGVDIGFDLLFLLAYSASSGSNSHRLWKKQRKMGKGQSIFRKLITIIVLYFSYIFKVLFFKSDVNRKYLV